MLSRGQLLSELEGRMGMMLTKYHLVSLGEVGNIGLDRALFMLRFLMYVQLLALSLSID